MNDWLRSAARGVAVATTIALVGACASKGNVVLLPEPDGRPTSVTVRQADTQIVLDRPYAAAKVAAQGLDAYQSSLQEVNAQFGPALAVQPIRAEVFVLYFVEAKDEFTDESKRQIEKVLAEVARRPVPDVLVVGHTDTVGTDQANDALGLQRAETVRAALIAFGVPSVDVQAISRGKRAPAVPTADGVAEPRNRRVEIIVR